MKKILLLSLLITYLFSNEYQEWLKAQEKEYTTYKKSMDEEFSSMLKQDWENFKSLYQPAPYKKPKPKALPKIKKEIKPLQKDIEKAKPLELKPKKVVRIEKPIAKETKLPVKKEIKTVEKNPFSQIKEPTKEVAKKIKKSILFKNAKLIEFSFYAKTIKLAYDKKMAYRIARYEKNSISTYWDIISKSNYSPTLKQFRAYKKEFSLNDWAMYQLIYKSGYAVYNNESMANLFAWFYLTKLGFDTKVGYNSNQIYLLSNLGHSVYQIAFFTLDNKKYYVLTPNGKIKKVSSIYTYKKSYPKSTTKMTFDINSAINFNDNVKTKELSFRFQSKLYKISTKYSKELVDFYKTFPQSDYNVYFNSKNSSLLSQSLLNEIRPLLKGKNELEAVNFLLRFVQTAFKYKTDNQNFKYEKVLFPEETIYYAYSDCEDRSIMFNFLIRNLTTLDIVGIKYPNHLAAAVAFSSKVSGKSFLYKGKRFTITDPTYVNANAGMVMPQFKSTKAKVVASR